MEIGDFKNGSTGEFFFSNAKPHVDWEVDRCTDQYRVRVLYYIPGGRHTGSN